MIRQRGSRDAVTGLRWTLNMLLCLSYLVAIAASGSSPSPSASASASTRTSSSSSSSLAFAPKKTAAAIATSASAAVTAIESSATSAAAPGIQGSASAAAKGNRSKSPQPFGKSLERTRLQQRQAGKLDREYHQMRSGSAMNSPYSILFYMRVGLAGGLAGATGTAVLYPMDCAKTLRQSKPETFQSVRQALQYLCVTKTPAASASASATSTVASGAAAAAASSATPHYAWHIQRAYVGWWPAVVGAIPSSALYFGAYESMKRFITRQTTDNANEGPVIDGFWHRLGIHATAAASGNMLSSMVFVPKELVKQQMQFQGTGVSFGNVLLQILEKNGVPGLYRGYQATLMRNIPSAMLRFALYEEFKYRFYTKGHAVSGSGSNDSSTLPPGEAQPFTWQLFVAGACAGALASGIMTPVDVLKTRISTGTCPVGVKSCVLHIVQEQGWKGMYAGARARMVWSGAFAAIGFGSFEAAKNLLGVPDNNAGTIQAKTSAPRSYKTARISTKHQRRLDHASSDAYEVKTVSVSKRMLTK